MSSEEGTAILADDQRRTLAAVLDEIIPPSEDGRLPGAGEAGLADAIEQEMDRSPDLRLAVEQGLEALDRMASEQGSTGFASLSHPDRLQALTELGASQPAFLPGLMFHTFVGYYQNARVVEALGLEARPPHPKGYELEEGDLSLLDDVRRRSRLYREV